MCKRRRKWKTGSFSTGAGLSAKTKVLHLWRTLWRKATLRMTLNGKWSRQCPSQTEVDTFRHCYRDLSVNGSPSVAQLTMVLIPLRNGVDICRNHLDETSFTFTESYGEPPSLPPLTVYTERIALQLFVHNIRSVLGLFCISCLEMQLHACKSL